MEDQSTDHQSWMDQIILIGKQGWKKMKEDETIYEFNTRPHDITNSSCPMRKDVWVNQSQYHIHNLLNLDLKIIICIQ
jgi:hypothetical protein